jgi:S-(hydroxymethyl)glutathione dehydrogenase / alcohol dehydrogenase
MPKKMIAAVLESPGEGDVLSLREVGISDPGPMEVLVRILMTGVCRSDIHLLRGVWTCPTPVILGHEGCGVIEKVGPGVSESRIGDKVILTFAPNCGTCRFCIEGRNVLCEAAEKAAAQGTMYDGTTRFSDHEKPIYHLALTSTFCEYTIAPHNGAITIPAKTPPEHACLLGCGAMTGFGAVLNTAKVRPGESVVVFGCGGVGLSVIQASKLCNALPIVAVDSQGSKEAAARQFGAADFIHATGPDPVPAVRRIIDGGADFAFEAAGRVDTADMAYRATRRGGTTVLIGQPAENAKVGLPPYGISQDEQRIIGSSYGSAQPLLDFPKILRLAEHGLLDLDNLVSDIWPLDQINKAIAAAETGELKRIVLRVADR